MPVAPTSSESHQGGDVIDRHRHDDHQLIYVSSGVLAITTEHGSWVASSDRALWVPAGIWHEHRFYGHSEFHTIGFPAPGTPLLPAKSPSVIAVDPLLRELLIALTSTGLSVAEAERRLIQETLNFTHHNKTRAAEMLGISLKTLHNKLKDYESESQS